MKGGAIILSRAREKARANSEVFEEEPSTPLHVNDVDGEQKKYNSFWEGIQRRIAMKKNTPPLRNRATIAAQELKNKKPDKTVIHPLNNNKVAWDIFICLLVIYSIIMIPIRIGFEARPALGFAVFDGFIDCVFFLDMCLTFNTAYFDNALEMYIYSRELIALNYLKFWFWIDLVSTIPIDDFVGLFISHHRHFAAIRAVRILRLGRLFKLQRLDKLSDYLEENMGVSSSQINLILLMMQIFFVAHVFACFWHLLGQPSTDTARTWLSEGGFDHASLETQYIAALYFTIVTMLTVGYGDIHPTNPSERLFSIFMMLSGGIIFGALLSKVASVIEKRHPQARAFKENMDEVRAFLEEYAVPLHVKAKAKEAYSYYLTKKSSFGESGIFEDLPQPLLFKLVLQLYEKDIKKVQLFCTYECSFVVELVINSKPFQAVRGEILYNQGDVIKEVVFIPTGMVRLSIENGSGKDVLAGFATEGTYFGDMEYLKNSVVTMAQYSAMNSCEFLSVSHQVMSQAIAENLDSGTMFKGEVEKRLATFLRVTKSQVKGEFGRATVRRSNYRPRVSGTAPNTSRGLFSSGSTPDVSAKPAASGRFARRSSTTGAHASIWLNGQVRDHAESAHYIRMALRNGSENMVIHASRKRAALSSGPSKDNLGSLPSDPSGLQSGLSRGPSGLKPGLSRGPSGFYSGLSSGPSGLNQDDSTPSVGLPGLPLGGLSTGGRSSIGLPGMPPGGFSPCGRSTDLPGLPPSGPTSSGRSSGLPDMPSGGFSASGQPIGLPGLGGGGGTDTILSMVQSSEQEGATSCRVLTYDEDGTQLIADISHRSLHRMFLVDPKEPWKVQWDVVLAAVILYTVLTTPVEIAFYNDTPVYSDELEIVLNCIFFADLVLSFRTCFVSSVESALVIDPSEIAVTYAKSWFLVDFLSCLPYGPMFDSLLDGHGLQSVKLLKTFRLIRLTKLGRIFKLDVFIGRLEDTLGLPRGVFELLQVLVEVFFIGHLVACIWWGVSDAISANPWFTKPELVYKDLSHSPVGEKYVFSLYFTFTTMTTVGYGDIYASNTGEMILNIFLILLGASVFGYIIANVSTILESFTRVESVQRDRIGVIKEYLGEKGCPRALEKKVVGHFRHLFSITSAYQVDKIMSRLPASVRDEIMFYHNESKLKNIPIFRYIPNRSMALYIFKQLTPVFFDVDQYIIKQGRESNEINFLVIGSACAFTTETKKGPTKPKTRRKGGANLFAHMKATDEATYNQARMTFLSPPSAESEDHAELEGLTASLKGPGVAKMSSKLSFEQKIESTETEEIGFSADSAKGPTVLSMSQRARTSFTSFTGALGLEGSAKTAPVPPRPQSFDFVKENNGLRIVGDFSPGDFVGHASLMNDALNECSIVATAPCTVFVLTKAVIYKLIHTEPIVGMKLQEALALAIGAQAQTLGQAHRRQNRAEFLRDLKDKAMEFHTRGDPALKKPAAAAGMTDATSTKNSVKSTLTALHDRETTTSGRGFFDGPHAPPKEPISPKELKIKPRKKLSSMSKNVSMVKKVQNFRSLRRHLSYRVGIVPINEDESDSIAAKPTSKTVRSHLESVRKLRKIDAVLNDKTMLYDSDDEFSARIVKENVVNAMKDLAASEAYGHKAHEKPRQRLQRILRRALRQLRYEKAQKVAQAMKLAHRPTITPHNTPHASHPKTIQPEVQVTSPLVLQPPSPLPAITGSYDKIRRISAPEQLRGRPGAQALPPIETHRPRAHSLAGDAGDLSKVPGPGDTSRVALSRQTTAEGTAHAASSAASPHNSMHHRSAFVAAIQSVSHGLTAIATHAPLLHAGMSRCAMANLKKTAERNRRWSFAAVEGSFTHLGAHQQHKAVQREKPDDTSTSLATNTSTTAGEMALEKKIVVRVRRQSFPSLSNQAWKDALAYQGLL